ncbi:MAG: restriction endonuclease [Candidatus Aminicenantes bacterium]|nr:restriction endonuclease [Candidatus Aminicenantes bacterium]NIM82833.1 restriction endonuclease [Candidatus Aminicenantes bacterium]NIN22209.1 restriction endonuclease [Candidatus Aminicenantes bacterium]NIN45977.1 restriction endonuclease [Candidatus Aminicenantes bacterium]NIN88813.1 restriction endonuclease [Candidatus Aminicenantes bacterium]
MAIPDYQACMKPLLQFLADGEEYPLSQCVIHLVKVFKLSDDERHEMLPSGKQRIIDNRVGWARTYLKKAGLIDIPRRGYSKITKRGLNLLKKNPDEITNETLKQYPEFRDFIKDFKKIEDDTKENKAKEEEKTPEEELEEAFQRLNREVEDELLNKLKSSTPEFFERMVIDLLLAMGYGGSRKEAGKAIGGTGDEGIDGVISEDRLGLDKIYIQAKRWQKQNRVSRPEVQKFAGALQGKRAKKGIFITTSDFTGEAQQFVDGIENRIILIDGKQLVQLMMQFNVGVEINQVFELKKIDNDYFEE